MITNRSKIIAVTIAILAMFGMLWASQQVPSAADVPVMAR